MSWPLMIPQHEYGVEDTHKDLLKVRKRQQTVIGPLLDRDTQNALPIPVFMLLGPSLEQFLFATGDIWGDTSQYQTTWEPSPTSTNRPG